MAMYHPMRSICSFKFYSLFKADWEKITIWEQWLSNRIKG